MEVGNAVMGDDRLGKPDPSILGFAFFGGNLSRKRQFVSQQRVKQWIPTSAVDRGL
jgi:hypothetical protein